LLNCQEAAPPLPSRERELREPEDLDALMAVIFDDQTRQWFMALTLRGESFSMPLGDPLPMEGEGGCSEDQLGLDLPQPETNATACGAVSGTSAACALANCADCEQKQAAPSASQR
jgi:hypothetical protein